MDSPILRALRDLAKGQDDKTIIELWRPGGGVVLRWTWKEYLTKIDDCARSLGSLGVKRGHRVLIKLSTSLEWDLIEKGCYQLLGALIAVDPLVQTWTFSEILQLTHPDLIITEDSEVSSLKELIQKGNHPEVKVVGRHELRERMAGLGIVEEGRRECTGVPSSVESHQLHRLGGDDVGTIVFSSGTSGQLKAVSYSQVQILEACREMIAHEGGFGGNLHLLAWLPLAPLFQRVVNICCLLMGSKITFLENPQFVFEALNELRPSLFIAVPHFYEKLELNLSLVEDRWRIFPPIIRKQIGRRFLRRCFSSKAILLSGSAALKFSTQDFFEDRGFPIYEAYGLTENLLLIAMNTPRSRRKGSVGKPFKANQLRIEEDGALKIKGPFVAKTYWGRISERWDEEGFFETGDLVKIDQEGFLYLKGRMSFLLKLANGKKIFRSELEQKFDFKLHVDHFLVFGNERPYPVALLFLSETLILSGGDVEGWEQQLKDYLIQWNNSLAPQEQVWFLLVIPRPLSVDGDEITRNFKVRYDNIEKNFESEIARFYDPSFRLEPRKKPKDVVLRWSSNIYEERGVPLYVTKRE